MKTKNYFFEIVTMVMVLLFLVAIFLFANAFLKTVLNTIVAKVIAAIVLASVFWHYSGALIRMAIDRLSARTIIFAGVVIFLIIALSSCASTRDSYSEVNGKLTNLQKHRTENYIAVQRAQRIEENEQRYLDLDFKKLQKQSVRADSINGYMGKIANFSRWQNIQFDVYHKEPSGQQGRVVLSEFLAPGQQIVRYLLPGEYLVRVSINGRLKDIQTFPVETRMKGFFGESLHWYIYRED